MRPKSSMAKAFKTGRKIERQKSA